MKYAAITLVLLSASSAHAETLASEAAPIVQISTLAILSDLNGCTAGHIFNEDIARCQPSLTAKKSAEEKY